MDSPRYFRPLTDTEMFWEMSHHRGQFIIAYILELETKLPLDIETLKNSLEILQRKVETLQLCITSNDEGKMMFTEQSPLKIDFEVDEVADYATVVDKMITTPFNSAKGPLWRVRLISAPTESRQQGIPFKYTLVLAFHHVICDGFSNIKLCNLLLQIWNDRISGNSVADDVVAKLITTDWIQEKMAQGEKELAADPHLKEKFKIRFSEFAKNVTQLQRMPPHDPKLPNDTQFLDKIIDQKKTALLKDILKSHGVTFHSGLTAIMDFTLFQTHRRLGNDTSRVVIQCNHVTNTRRFDPPNKDNFGTHIQPTLMRQTLDSNTDMWEYAKSFEEKLKRMINEHYFKYDFCFTQLAPKTDKSIDDIFLKSPEDASYDYAITNMGNVNAIFPGDGEHVQVTSMLRRSKSHEFGQLFSLIVHTFRGRLQISLAYVNKYIQEAAATRLLEDLITNIDAVISGKTVK